jgi:hypothetical protein
MTSEERARLIEQTASAWRPRDRDGGVRSHPSWHDLDERDRVKSFEVGAELRAIEAALDVEGLSSTGRAVVGRIRGVGR